MALPERRRPLLLLGLAFASVLVLAGCGSSGDAGDAGGEHHGHAGGTHDMESAAVEPIELPAGAKAPRLTLTATPDAMGGFNVRVRMANFRLAPEHTFPKGHDDALQRAHDRHEIGLVEEDVCRL